MKCAILSCTGLDKPEGSLAREVAILAADITGSEIVCPVLLNRAPARYRKTLGECALIIVDGCSTRCATKLAAGLEAKVARKVSISDAAKASHMPFEPTLRPGTGGLALAQAVADQLVRDLNAPAVAAEVDRVLADAAPSADTGMGTSAAQCACSNPVPGGKLIIKGAMVSIPGLPLIFEQCAERSIPADESGSAALLDIVKIYYCILQEVEPEYRRALLAAYQDFRRNKP